MTTTIALPSDVMSCLNRHELNHRPVLLSTESDLCLSGGNRRHWLIVTADHLSVVVEPQSDENVPTAKVTVAAESPASISSDATLLRAISVEQIKSVRTWAGLGSGILQVRTDDALSIMCWANTRSMNQSRSF